MPRHRGMDSLESAQKVFGADISAHEARTPLVPATGRHSARLGVVATEVAANHPLTFSGSPVWQTDSTRADDKDAEVPTAIRADHCIT